jgi:mannosyltransferase PIG-V
VRDRGLRTFLGIRIAFWLGVALTLLWAPLRGSERIPPFRAYDGLTDLLFGAFAQWDSVWFIHVADFGYDSREITAFLPLYPLVVRGVAEVTRSTIVAGVLVSLAAAGVGAVLLKRIAGGLGRDAVLLLALFPTAYVFTAVYSEGLFLALATGSFLAGLRRQSLLAGVLGGLAAATRVVGLALLPALVILLWQRQRSWRSLAPVLLVPGGLGVYALYLHRRFGDAFAFAHAQGSTDWNRETPALGPLSGLWQAASSAWHSALELLLHLPRSQNYPAGYSRTDMWATWNVVQFALLVAAIWLTWVAWRRLGPAFGVYSAGLLAILLAAPAQLSPLVSFPRYLLADFPLFVALAAVLEGRPRLRTSVLLLFAAAAAVAAVAFSRKIWVA